jgi:hypothetical protein
MLTKKPRLQPSRIVSMKKRGVPRVGRVIIGYALSGRSASKTNRPNSIRPKLSRFLAITAENVDRTSLASINPLGPKASELPVHRLLNFDQ